MTALSSPQVNNNKHAHTYISCGGVCGGGRAKKRKEKKKATPKVKTSQPSDTKFQQLNSGYLEHFISRLTDVSGSISTKAPKFKKWSRIPTAWAQDGEPPHSKARARNRGSNRGEGRPGPPRGVHKGRRSNPGVPRRRAARAPGPAASRGLPTRSPARPALPPTPARPHAHLGHIVLHLIQIPVLQGPHELLVAHHCGGQDGPGAGQRRRGRRTRGHEQTTRLGPPRGRGCGPRRPLGREKVLWQPLGPAERVPPGWGGGKKQDAYTSGSRPARTRLRLPLPLPLHGTPRSGPRPSRLPPQGHLCAGSESGSLPARRRGGAWPGGRGAEAE